MKLGHLLTHSGLTYPEVSSKVCHDSICHLGNSVSLPWVIYYETFYFPKIMYCVIHQNNKGKGKGHACTGTEALYRPYGP